MTHKDYRSKKKEIKFHRYGKDVVTVPHKYGNIVPLSSNRSKKKLRIKENAKYGCPQNKREDLVWKKGYGDGFEVANISKKYWHSRWQRADKGRREWYKECLRLDKSIRMYKPEWDKKIEEADLKRFIYKRLFLITLLAFLISVLV